MSVDAVKYPKTPKKANRQEVHIEEKDESEYEHQPKEEEIGMPPYLIFLSLYSSPFTSFASFHAHHSPF